MIRNFLLICLIISTAFGCTRRMVGGPCEYETLLGTAQITGQDGDMVEARFYPADPAAASGLVRLPAEMTFGLNNGRGDERTGVPYPAQLSVITEGTCTPYSLTLLSGEHFSDGLFLPFTNNGEPTQEAKQTILQAATLFDRLAPDRPDLTIDLCSQSPDPESGYSKIVAEKLAAQAIPPAQVRIRKTGEAACPDSWALDTDAGVWLYFRLAGDDGNGAG